MNRQRLQETGCLLFGFGILMLILMPTGTFNVPRPAARRTACQSNLKQLSTALRLYAGDNDDHLPPAGQWASSTSFYLRLPPGETTRPTRDRRLQCPSDIVGMDAQSYALNSNTSGREAVTAPVGRVVVLIFESNLHRDDAAGTREALAQPARHEESGGGLSCGRKRSGNVYAFLDGHVKWLLDAPSFAYPSASQKGPLSGATRPAGAD